MKKFPFIMQFDSNDCGPTCVRMIAKYYGKDYSAEEIVQKTGLSKQGITLSDIADVAEAIGLKTLAVNVDIDTLVNDAPLPCIAYWKQRHFIVVYKIKTNKIYVADPAYGTLKLTKQEFMHGWLGKDSEIRSEGLLMLLETTPSFFEYKNINNKKKNGIWSLSPYFKAHRKVIYQLLLGLFIASTIQIITPFLTQAVVDYGINYQDLNFIYIILVAQLMLFLSRSFNTMIRDWLLLHLSTRVNIALISDFLIKLMSLPLSFYDSRRIGDILQRIRDHDRVNDFLSTETLNIFFSSFSFLAFGIILWYYSFYVFTIYFIGTALYILWVLLFMKKRAELDYLSFDQASLNQSTLVHLVQGMQEIKLNNSERKRRWKWEEIQISLFKISMKNLSLVQYQYNGGLMISEVKHIFITFIVAKSVIEGKLTLGTMLAIQYIIGQLNNPIRFFISFIQSFQDSKMSLDRLNEIHNLEEEKQENYNYSDSMEGDIIISNLSFRYGLASSPLVLKKLNLTIPKGKITAIVGVSGSGKTTLLKLLMKFYQIKEGAIHIKNTNLENLNTQSWRKICGVVMQDGYIFNDTIAANIAESDTNGINKNLLQQAVELANMKEHIESLPAGYNTKIGEEGISLSGGQKQRILIARAIYKNPKYLFFDEATSSLDANNERVIMENLEQFYKGRTVLIIAHRLSTVKNADQIVVLDKGEISEIGTHHELTALKGIYYTLVKNQLELGN